jgi:hypothetical protein
LEHGRIPFRKVGNRRKVRLADLQKYREEEEEKRTERERRWKEMFVPDVTSIANW